MRKIKAVFLTEQKYYPNRNLVWSKNSDEVLKYFHDDLKVSEVYFIYAAFKGYIKNLEAKQVLLNK